MSQETQEIQEPRSSKIAIPRNRNRSAGRMEAIGAAASWGVIGQAVGLVVSLFIPDRWISDFAIISWTGGVVAALYGIGVVRNGTPPPLMDVAKCLRAAQLLFIKNAVTRKEYKALRESCIKRAEAAL